MNTRERVLVGMMVAAIGGAGLNACRSSSTPAFAQRTPEQVQAEAEQFTQESYTRLADAWKCPREKHALAQLGEAWSINPFANQAIPVAAPGHVGSAGVEYCGYLDIDGQRFALINGRARQLGDPLPDTRYHVSDIHPEQIVLSVTNSGETITVTLRDVSDKRRGR